MYGLLLAKIEKDMRNRGLRYDIEPYELFINENATSNPDLRLQLPEGLYYFNHDAPAYLETHVKNILSVYVESDNGTFTLARPSATGNVLYLQGVTGQRKHSRYLRIQIVPNALAGTCELTLPFLRVEPIY